MMMQKQIFNKKTLAEALGTSTKTLNAEINSMLQDDSIRREFGTYRRRRFSQKQINIMSEHLPIMEGLKFE